MFKLVINTEALRNLTLAMQEHAALFDKLAEADAELTRRFGGWNGPSAEKALAAERAKIEAQREAARQSMRALVESAKAAFLADIDRQTMLDGAAISAADLALLQGGLVDSADELASIRERHITNPTMRRAVAQYADKRNWSGFSDETNAATVREFGEQLFKMAESGATVPTGIGGLTLSDFAHVERLLAAYGLAE